MLLTKTCKDDMDFFCCKICSFLNISQSIPNFSDPLRDVTCEHVTNTCTKNFCKNCLLDKCNHLKWCKTHTNCWIDCKTYCTDWRSNVKYYLKESKRKISRENYFFCNQCKKLEQVENGLEFFEILKIHKQKNKCF